LGVFTLKLLTLFLVFVLVVSNVSAITGSVGNLKVVLRPEVNSGDVVVIDRVLKINNVNDDDIKVTLTPDQILDSFSEIIDKEFVLKPGESKDAKFKLSLKNSGTYTGHIYVRFSELEGKNPGVVLSSTVTIVASGTAPEFVEPEETDEEVLNEEVTENNENNENNESETVDNQYYDYESDGAETNSGEQIWYYFVYPEATSNGFQEGYLAQNNKYLEELQTEESEEIAAAGDRLDSNIVPLEEKAPGNSNTWLEVLAVFLPGSIWFLSRYLSKLRGP